MSPITSAEFGASALLIDHHLDPVLARESEQAALLAGILLQRWAPGDQVVQSQPPRVVLASLARGSRRLPAAVAHLADEVFPGIAVVLVSDEPLVQPYILLHGGRLTLLAPPHESVRIAERLTAAMAWQPTNGEAGTTSFSALPSADPVVRQDLHHGRGLAAWVLTDDGERVSVSASLGLTAVLAPRALPGVAIDRDLLPTLDAWHDQPESDQLRRILGARSAGAWSTLIHLDPDSGRWLLAAPGAWPVRLASRQRLPPWWELPTSSSDDAVRVLTAEPGDVVLAHAPFPALPEFSAEVLAAAAEGGAVALADHLAAAARSHRCAVAAVALEVRS